MKNVFQERTFVISDSFNSGEGINFNNKLNAIRCKFLYTNRKPTAFDDVKLCLYLQL